jgi:hypothetical protein
MSAREKCFFVSFLRLHFGHVHIDTRAGAGEDGQGAVTLQVRQPDLLGRPSTLLWSRQLDLRDLVPGASTAERKLM